jgi:O-antigen/teichoic acid export membrane protein/predicted O-methyltransferase YrrM
MVPIGITPWIFQFGTGLFAVKAAARGVSPRRLLGSVGALDVAFGLAAAVAGSLWLAGFLAAGRPVVEHFLIIGFAIMPAALVLALIGDILWGLECWSAVLPMQAAPALFWAAATGGLYFTGRLTVSAAATAFILSSFVAILPALAHVRVLGRPQFRARLARDALAFGSKIWLGTLAQTANNRLDQLMMITLVSTSQLGLYSVAVTIAGLSGVLSNPIASIAVPRVAGADPGFTAQATRLGLLVAIGTSTAVAVVVPFFLPLVFTAAFSAAIPATLLLLVAAVFSTGTAILRPALAAADRPGVGSFSELASLVITVPGLLVLLPILGGVGAALVSIAAYAGAFLVLAVSAKRRFELPLTAFMIPRVADARWLIARLAPPLRTRMIKLTTREIATMLDRLRLRRRRARERLHDVRRAVEFRLNPREAARIAGSLDAAGTHEQRFALVQQSLPGGSHQRPTEILPFLQRASTLRPQRILEIGTGDGGTTILLSRVSDSVEWLAGVDLLVKNKPRIRRLAPTAQTVVLIDGPSTASPTFDRVVQALDGALLDVLFIDGDHSYEGVRADYERYSHLVRPGGLIAFHDICEDHHTRFGRFTGAYAGGVPIFWREVSASSSETQEFVDDRAQDGCGIGVITVQRPTIA